MFAHHLPPAHLEGDELITETQTMLFIKNCILPVAMKARALIIISATNDCSLSVAVQKIMGPVQKRMGKKCPFTIIGYASLNEVYAKINVTDCIETEETVSSQYYNNSNNVKKRKIFIAKAVQKEKDDNKKKCFVYDKVGNNKQIHGSKTHEKNYFRWRSNCDLNSVCTHIILFEGIDDRINVLKDRSKSFMNTFLEHLVTSLPSLAIQAQKYESVSTLSDIVSRKIPLLLLDSRERWVSVLYIHSFGRSLFKIKQTNFLFLIFYSHLLN